MYGSSVSVKVLCSVHMSFVTLATYLVYVLINSDSISCRSTAHGPIEHDKFK